MKSTFLILLFSLSTLTCLAQIPMPQKVEQSQGKQAPTIKFNGLGLGVGLEVALSSKQSLYTELGSSFVLDATTVYSTTGQQTTQYELVPLPYLSLEYRYYYNLDKRQHAKRDVDAFCSNYTGFFARRVSIRKYDIAFWNFAPIWGMQRRYWNFLYFDAHIGPSIYIADEESLILPHLKFAIGLSLQYGQ